MSEMLSYSTCTTGKASQQGKLPPLGSFTFPKKVWKAVSIACFVG